MPKWLIVWIALFLTYSTIANYCRFKEAIGISSTCSCGER